MGHRRSVFFALAVLLVQPVVSGLLSYSSAAAPLPPGQDKAFSEFNHHVAGAFLLLIGIFAALGNSSTRWRLLGIVWPFFFIIPGLYLAFMSDPDVWPLGEQGWKDAFHSNPEAAQHKIFSLLLLLLGGVELQRMRGRLGKFLSVWAFPFLALLGALLLFFHPHEGAMTRGMTMNGMEPTLHEGMPHGSHQMTDSMLKVQRQHFWFSLVGFGVALTKFLYDGRFMKKPFAPYLWPSLVAVLGVLLLFYTE